MADNESKFSASEMRYITAFFSNMTSTPDVDWDQVAVDAGLKGARCARDRFRQIMGKHGFQGATAGGSPRKAKTGVAEETGGASPGKVTKRAPRKKPVKKKAEQEEENEDEKAKKDVKGEDSSDA